MSTNVTSVNESSLLAEAYGNLSDEQWFRIIAGKQTWLDRLTALISLRFNRNGLPLTVPDDAYQVASVGSSGEKAMREGFDFYQIVKKYSKQFGNPISRHSTIFDFGCGWGRMTRFFFKDVPAEQILAADVDPLMIDHCNKTFSTGRFFNVAPNPPTHLPDSSVDVIYAYSVFSHLAENVSLAWIREFARILKPAGLLLATTQKRSFIDYCNSLTANEAVSVWQKNLLQAFRPHADALRRYDAGEMLYYPTGGGANRDKSFYGEAAIPEGYVDSNWQPYLVKRLFDDQLLSQALIIVQKP